MNHLITLWLMIAPGTWDKQELTFDNFEDCHQATHILMDRGNESRYIDLPEVYKNPREGSGLMFEDRCR